LLAAHFHNDDISVAGGVLLSVHGDTSEQIASAKDVLKHTGAQDISSAGEASADIPAAASVAVH
jgi:hypothetical protein